MNSVRISFLNEMQSLDLLRIIISQAIDNCKKKFDTAGGQLRANNSGLLLSRNSRNQDPTSGKIISRFRTVSGLIGTTFARCAGQRYYGDEITESR